MPTAVEDWFGPAFSDLHPLLQQLHREGGSLSGPVDVRFGTGLGAVLGRLIARRLGIASQGVHDRLKVHIHSKDGALHWGRQFNQKNDFTSRFIPVGCYPTGHWVESSGPVRLHLAVAVIDGGWHWQHLRTRLWGLPLPRVLMPQTEASKRICDGRYCFRVAISLPLLGPVLSYAGELTLAVAQQSGPDGETHGEG